MIVKNGLLIISNPKHITKVLNAAKERVKNTLYIQLLSNVNEPISAFLPNVYTSVPMYSQVISCIYKQAILNCHHLDVRVLLSSLKYGDAVDKIQTLKPIDMVIYDKVYNSKTLDAFVNSNIGNISDKCEFMTIDCGVFENIPLDAVDNDKMYKHTVMGGTYDRLHAAHKILLSNVALRALEKVTVGVTEDNMNRSKLLWELIEPIDIRIQNVKNFLDDICPELTKNVVPITDPMGPTKSDPTMDLLVVSEETMRGGNKVNEVRQNNNLNPLDILKIDLVEDPCSSDHEEDKISSSSGRIRLLGDLLKPLNVNHNIARKPYIIGLTGSIASGKSGISQHLKNLGAHVIDCDKVGHACYKLGTKCYNEVVATFGEKVVGENKEINRPVLGSIVFGHPEQMEKLNNIVWPSIMEEAMAIVKETKNDIVVIEAAVLFQAGWEKYCHELWVSIIPSNEATVRLTNRSLNEEQAKARLDSLPPNKYYVDRANVVFCSLWDVEYTRLQVVKAFELLKNRMQQAIEA